VIRVGVALTVTGLAVVLPRSASTTCKVAARPGEIGWRSLAFPISVDGLEIVL